jgi:hypothetical protein
MNVPRSKQGERRYMTRGRLPDDWDKMSFVALWNYLNPPRRTPRTTIEAVMYAVRERGVAALREAANIERLTRCDEVAKTEINERIAKLIAKQEIAA